MLNGCLPVCLLPCELGCPYPFVVHFEVPRLLDPYTAVLVHALFVVNRDEPVSLQEHSSSIDHLPETVDSVVRALAGASHAIQPSHGHEGANHPEIHGLEGADLMPRRRGAHVEVEAVGQELGSFLRLCPRRVLVDLSK